MRTGRRRARQPTGLRARRCAGRERDSTHCAPAFFAARVPAYHLTLQPSSRADTRTHDFSRPRGQPSQRAERPGSLPEHTRAHHSATLPSPHCGAPTQPAARARAQHAAGMPQRACARRATPHVPPGTPCLHHPPVPRPTTGHTHTTISTRRAAAGTRRAACWGQHLPRPWLPYSPPLRAGFHHPTFDGASPTTGASVPAHQPHLADGRRHTHLGVGEGFPRPRRVLHFPLLLEHRTKTTQPRLEIARSSHLGVWVHDRRCSSTTTVR